MSQLLGPAKKLKASFVFNCVFSLDPSKRTHELPWAFGLQTLKWEDVSLTTWGLITAGETRSQSLAEKLCLNEIWKSNLMKTFLSWWVDVPISGGYSVPEWKHDPVRCSINCGERVKWIKKQYNLSQLIPASNLSHCYQACQHGAK